MTADETATESLESILESDVTPTEDGDPVFDAAWQARIFGLSVSMRGEDGVFKWESFQQRLAEEIAASEDSDATTDRETDPEDSATPDDIEEEYYRQWLAAFERLLVENGHVDPAQLDERTAEFAAGDRTAAEFVEGDHESAHGHEHQHSH